MNADGGLGLSVDLDEWFQSRRWVDGSQTRDIPDSAQLLRRLYGSERPIGEIIPPTRALLDLFDKHNCKVTFFVLGEIAEWYPALVAEVAQRGHEIACHGLRHVDITLLGPDQFGRDLDVAVERLTTLAGARPVGYRAPNLVYPNWATRVLESRGFLYDSTVHVSRRIGDKYRGWAKAPVHPYRPSYQDIAIPGDAQLVELPLPPFPGIRVAAGSSIFTRVIGYHWTATALRRAARRGTTMYYVHPWEVGSRPTVSGNRLKNAIFLRRVGPWMLRALDRILTEHRGRILTARACAERCLSAGPSPAPRARARA